MVSIMIWSKGYTASYYAYIVDTASWRETERIMITGGSISRSNENLRQSATIESADYRPELEQWIRIYMDTEQDGASAHEPLFTGLATTPTNSYEGERATGSLDCYSVLKPAEDVLLQRGSYYPAGTNGAQAVKNLLSVSPCPIVIEGESEYLQTAIIAEDDESNLSMADKILSAINWRLRISGDGTVTICKQADTESAFFEAMNNDCLELSVELERDLFSCPNVFRAISDDMSAVARDDDPNSILSTVSRKREVWAQEDDCDLGTNESLAAYAQRRLKELQTVAVKASYNRRYLPDLLPTDIVKLNYPKQNLVGLYRVDNQNITLGYAAQTSEEVYTA